MNKIDQLSDLRDEVKQLKVKIDQLEHLKNDVKNLHNIIFIVVPTVAVIVGAVLTGVYKLFDTHIEERIIALFEKHAKEEIQDAKKRAIDAATEIVKIKDSVSVNNQLLERNLSDIQQHSTEINNITKEAQDTEKLIKVLNEIIPQIIYSVKGVEICKQDGAKMLKVDRTSLNVSIDSFFDGDHPAVTLRVYNIDSQDCISEPEKKDQNMNLLSFIIGTPQLFKCGQNAYSLSVLDIKPPCVRFFANKQR